MQNTELIIYDPSSHKPSMLQIQCHLLNACVFIFQYEERENTQRNFRSKLVCTGYTGRFFSSTKVLKKRTLFK